MLLINIQMFQNIDKINELLFYKLRQLASNLHLNIFNIFSILEFIDAPISFFFFQIFIIYIFYLFILILILFIYLFFSFSFHHYQFAFIVVNIFKTELFFSSS